ncbi:MAG: glycosyltransferase [Bacteroidaceae bacterium]|nr:glycosyltransferase [Bacteroidaceae bacterium]
MKKLAIVILNWNGAEMMRQYLPSVLQNSVGEVIVADNASSDGSVPMLMKEFPDVPLIKFDQNYGFADGYNKALSQLFGYEYYILLNSDVEIRQKDWDAPLIQYMDTHPDCAACQPKLLALKTLSVNSQLSTLNSFEYAGAAGGFLDKYGYPFCRGRVLDTIEQDEGQYDEIVPLMWATGAALMIRATDWLASGGLDARFFAHMEEIDLCWRLRTMGKSIVCVPQSQAYHLGGGSLNQGNPRKTFLNFRNNLMMLYKNLPDNELNSVMRMRWFLDYLAAFRFFLSGDYHNAHATYKARHAFNKVRKDLLADRVRIAKLRKVDRVPERTNFSLLWQYYLKGKKTFSALRPLLDAGAASS